MRHSAMPRRRHRLCRHTRDCRWRLRDRSQSRKPARSPLHNWASSLPLDQAAATLQSGRESPEALTMRPLDAQTLCADPVVPTNLDAEGSVELARRVAASTARPMAPKPVQHQLESRAWRVEKPPYDCGRWWRTKSDVSDIAQLPKPSRAHRVRFLPPTLIVRGKLCEIQWN